MNARVLLVLSIIIAIILGVEILSSTYSIPVSIMVTSTGDTTTVAINRTASVTLSPYTYYGTNIINASLNSGVILDIKCTSSIAKSTTTNTRLTPTISYYPWYINITAYYTSSGSTTALTSTYRLTKSVHLSLPRTTDISGNIYTLDRLRYSGNYELYAALNTGTLSGTYTYTEHWDNATFLENIIIYNADPVSITYNDTMAEIILDQKGIIIIKIPDGKTVNAIYVDGNPICNDISACSSYVHNGFVIVDPTNVTVLWSDSGSTGSGVGGNIGSGGQLGNEPFSATPRRYLGGTIAETNTSTLLAVYVAIAVAIICFVIFTRKP